MQLRDFYHNEYEVLSTLPPNRNIVRLHAFFYDRLGDNLPAMQQFDAIRNQARSLSLFLVMEHHPTTLAAACRQMREAGRLSVSSMEVIMNRTIYLILMLYLETVA